MQKLIFRNGAGTEIDMTSGNFGITEWEGFSADSLNIQSQQVPFQDGAVFLDALMEQRELSVTVAMQDNNNLEKRYELRRQMISTMNPKLGEGVLIYTNDFLSKQIHVIPQLPVFQNKNSNDSGTPKAECSFTACNPYWEDLEDTEITFQIGEQPIIKNEGDIPTQIEMDWFTNYIKNGRVTNVTKNQMIQYDGDLTDNLKIDTRIGKKSVTVDHLNFEINTISGKLNECVYISPLKLFVAVGNNGVILTSSDTINWYVSADLNVPITAIKYIETLHLIIIVGADGKIFTSTDVQINFIEQNSNISQNLNAIDYSEDNNIFVAVGENGAIITSPDTINWTSRFYASNDYYSVCHNESLFVVVGENGIILTSTDAINWATQTVIDNVTKRSITYSEEENIFVAVGENGAIITSPDTINWTAQTSGVLTQLNNCIYINDLMLFVAVGNNGVILASSDTINWIAQTSGVTENLNNITWCEQYGIALNVGDNGYILSSDNIAVWETLRSSANTYTLSKIIFVEDKNNYMAVGQNSTLLVSNDGINWQLQNVVDTSQTFNTIFYNGSLYLIGSAISGAIFVSSDSINWTRKTTGTGREVNGFAYSKSLDLYVVVTNGGYIRTNKNPLTSSWTNRTSGTNSNLLSITYSEEKNMFVAVGNNGVILTSSDTINWTARVSGVSTQLNDCIYIKELKLFIVVGNNGVILTSSDAINWTAQTSGISENLNGIEYSKDESIVFVVGNNGEILNSMNCRLWNKVNTLIKKNLNSISYSNLIKNYVIVGYSGIILNSIFTLAENRIQNISANSDIGMNLAIGDNKFRINKSDGNMVVRVKYRQKYIGV